MADLLDNIRRQPDSLREIRAFLKQEGAESLAAAADMLRGKKRLIFTGMGGSLYALMPAATWLARHGILANVMDAGELLYYGTVPEDAAVVALSRSGRTAETARLAVELKSRGVPVVALSNCPASPLADAADAVLRVAGDLDSGVSIQTYTGGVLTSLFLAAALTGEVASLDADVGKALDQLEFRVAAWQREAAAWKVDSFSHFFFLARGYSISSACEACLLVQELARRPATWYNAAEFRQGPVEALRRDHVVFVFSPEGRTAHLNNALAKDLARTGARIITVGGGLGVPEHLAPLLQIMPLQLAAYGIAAAGQQTPGEFRYAAAVSESEDGLAAG